MSHSPLTVLLDQLRHAAGADRPDAELLARLARGRDPDALQALIARHAPLVLGVCRRLLRNGPDVEDVFQATFLILARRAPALRPTGSLAAWLHTVARNRLRDWRAKRRERGSGDSAVRQRLEELPAPAAPGPDWDRDYERRVFAWAAEQVRHEFRASTWRAFCLTAVDGKSGPAAAAELGLSLGAVQVAKSRVLTRLKETVAPLLEGP